MFVFVVFVALRFPRLAARPAQSRIPSARAALPITADGCRSATRRRDTLPRRQKITAAFDKRSFPSATLRPLPGPGPGPGRGRAGAGLRDKDEDVNGRGEGGEGQ